MKLKVYGAAALQRDNVFFAEKKKEKILFLITTSFDIKE